MSKKKPTFEEKVKSMRIWEVVLAMVEGLRHPVTEINMGTFGSAVMPDDLRIKSNVNKGLPSLVPGECIVNSREIAAVKNARATKKLRCLGCAATNTIAEIAGIKAFSPLRIRYPDVRAKEVHAKSVSFLANFEWAIDRLRGGSLSGYNSYAKGQALGIETFPDWAVRKYDYPLPVLDNLYTEEQLKKYEHMALEIKAQTEKEERANGEEGTEVSA